MVLLVKCITNPGQLVRSFGKSLVKASAWNRTAISSMRFRSRGLAVVVCNLSCCQLGTTSSQIVIYIALHTAGLSGGVASICECVSLCGLS